tara:strand:+ start:180 stop:2405 length:2226 start_codon:yes stop_codon:yes gene_type:complete
MGGPALDEPARRFASALLSGGQMALAGLRAAFFAESDRWFLWTPVLVGAGIALYFAAPVEPPLWLAGTALVLAGVALYAARGAQWASLAVVAAATFCILLGFAAATSRTALTAAPVLQAPWSGTLTGRLLQSEVSNKGGLTLTIAPLTMQRLSADEMPARVRLSMRIKNVELTPGETLRLRARLMPPPDPVEPAGFDFARQVWFLRIGGVGFAYSAPDHLAPPPDDLTTRIARLRSAITARVRDTIGGPAGAVAAALITGEKRAIPKKTVDDLRRAGLSHVLSISGLHMVLFAGSLFWFLRAGLAASAHLALRYPIKKWAAAAALGGATFYLAISGAGVATQRAYVMIGLMFIAILLDRPAISMRNVALAALIVLLWQPESLLSASFHMSFAAVVALIAFYETPLVQNLLAPNREARRSRWLTPLRYAGRHFLGIAFTTAVAGFATGAYSAFHFNNIEPYSMVGNLGALPLVSFIVMPAALVALVLMPFGLDGPALWVMGQGIDVMLAVAHFVSSLEGAEGLVASAPLPALVLVTFGGLWMALWRRRWRFFGVLPIVMGLMFWNSGTKPALLIDRDGKLVALRGADDTLRLSSARPAYTAEAWLRHNGDHRAPKEAASKEFRTCDVLGCIMRAEGNVLVALPTSLDAMRDDCTRADVIVTSIGMPRTLRRSCKSRLVVDRFDLWRNGAIAFTIPAGEVSNPENWERQTARDMRGDRPWVRKPTARKKVKAEAATTVKPAPQ